jgi:hypothetical protein
LPSAWGIGGSADAPIALGLAALAAAPPSSVMPGIPNPVAAIRFRLEIVMEMPSLLIVKNRSGGLKRVQIETASGAPNAFRHHIVQLVNVRGARHALVD